MAGYLPLEPKSARTTLTAREIALEREARDVRDLRRQQEQNECNSGLKGSVE